MGHVKAKAMRAGLALAARVVKAALPAPPPWPPVFIIGAPRTGSTLLYQALTQRFKLGYINNLMARAPEHVVGGAAVSRLLFGRRPHGVFTSAHGETRGWNGPSECGEFWYRWFPRNPPYSPFGTLSDAAIAELQRETAGMMRAWGLPVIFKNMYCALRLEPLYQAFPQARLIHIKRDPLYTAQSLLAVRQARYGSKEAWWSMKPESFESIRTLHYCDQVVRQQYDIDCEIERAAKLFGPEALFECRYETFCKEPEAMLQRMRSWLGPGGVHLRSRTRIPSSFPVSKRLRLEREDLERLVGAITECYPRWEPPEQLREDTGGRETPAFGTPNT